MKLRGYVWIITAGLIVTGGIMFFDRLIKEAERANRTDIDQWIDRELAEILARKLHQPVEKILQTLTESSNPELVTLINETVNSVTLTFTRQTGNLNVQVRLDVICEDETSFTITTEQNWDNLPESIRSEFIRSGRNTTYRNWDFPWVQSQTV
jgi:hypothetical protein